MQNSGVVYGREYDFLESSNDYYGTEDFQFFPDSEEKDGNVMKEAAVSDESNSFVGGGWEPRNVDNQKVRPESSKIVNYEWIGYDKKYILIR